MKINNVDELLPPNNTYVLIHLTKNNWGDSDDIQNNRYWKVAKFILCDKEGNNELPYKWKEFGPSLYFGQEVDFWCELPNMENEK